MEIYVLASGSKGNMTYLKIGENKLFIDAGISYKKVNNKMEAYGEKISDVHSLLITHEHSDHISGIKMLLKKGAIRDVYLTKGTYECLASDVIILLKNIHFIESDIAFQLKDINVMPFMLSHDASEPVGFVFNYESKKIVLLTDSGYVDQSYYELLSDADLYILEANHHPTKLMKSPRPFMLKKRILGERGHLSNDDAAWLMNRLVRKKNSKWVIAHISQDCNSQLDIEESIVQFFDDPTKVEVFFASQEGLPVIKI